MSKPIYLDYHATTPVDPEVMKAMEPYFCEKFGNIASQHSFGREVQNCCVDSRKKIGDLLGCASTEIVMTSGATESNNMALKGIAFGMAAKGKHIITCETEHKSVLDTCSFLETLGYEVTYLKVDISGRVSAKQIKVALRHGKEGTTDRTILVAIMGANNEIGTLHPIAEIGLLLRDTEIIFHVDGAQLAGKVPLDVKASHIDLLSVSGHKIYGPKGIGALYINDTKRELMNMVPLLHGGGQEGGMRAGTLPVSLFVGLGKAAEISLQQMQVENIRLLKLRERLHKGISSECKVELNGDPEFRLPGNLNLTFRGIESELLNIGLRDIAVSSTSACSAGGAQPSHVLLAIGRSPAEAMSSIRFGIGRYTTEQDIDFAISKVNAVVKKYTKRPKALAANETNF